jgi:hypothetical protein
MRRITLLLLPVLTLAACQDQLPTSADASDAAVAGIAADLEYDLKVNLTEATAVPLYLDGETRLPLSATLKNLDNLASTDMMHEFEEGCPIHFPDLDGDQDGDGLVLHFSVAALFDGYDVSAVPQVVQVELSIQFAEEPAFTPVVYDVLLVDNPANGWQRGKQNGR